MIVAFGLKPGVWLVGLGLDRRQRTNLIAMLVSTLGNSAFCRLTVFGSAFVLFLDHLGVDKGRIGMLLSLIPFAGLSSLIVASFVSRIGFRRAYIAFFSVRKVAIALLLLLPAVSARWGSTVALIWVAASVAAFALCRTIGEVGGYAWFQEVVPNPIRGQFGAATYGVVTASGMAATFYASWALRGTPETPAYLGVIGVGVVAGAMSVAALLFIGGGARIEREAGDATAHGEMRDALADRNFVRYLTGLGCANLAISLAALTPLFMKECAHLAPGTVVLLDAAVSLGGLTAAAGWGRTADRRGSRPVLVAALVCSAMAPLAMAVPGLIAGPAAALVLTLWIGAAQTGWYIASERYLYVKAIRPDKRMGYVAVFYALAGVTNGAGPLTAGWLVEWSRAAGFPPYTPVFLLSAAFALAGVAMLRRVESDAE